MAIVKLLGDSSGYVQLVANTAAQNNTLTLPNVNDTLANITSPIFLSNIALAGTGTAPTLGLFTPNTNQLGFATNSTQQMVIDAGGNVGIGTNLVSVSGRLTVWGDQVQAAGLFTSFWNSDGTNLGVGRARGSVAAPSALLSGDRIGSLIGSGYTSSNTASNTASVEFYTEENYSATAAGSQIRFATTAPTTVGRSVKMVIQGSGNVGINSSTPTQTLDVQGNVNVLNTVIMGSSFLRNRIINGGMQVSQRQAVNVGSNVPTSGQGYGPDRFWGVASIANTIVLFQVTKNLAGFTYALRVQRNVSSTNAATWYVGQTIESFNCQDLAGQTVTFSFYLSAGAQYSGSGVTVQVWTGTGTDEGTTALNNATWTGQTLLLNLTIIPSTTWTKYSYAVPVGAGINEMAVRWNSTTSGTAGAQDSIDISGVQLEPGPVATPFERRQYGTELSLCQRYYWINSSATNSVSYYMPVFAFSTTVAYGVIEFPVTMRTTPTISTTGTPANYRIILGGAAYALTGGPAIDQATPYSSSIGFITAGTLTVGQAGMAGANSSTAAFLGFNAEL